MVLFESRDVQRAFISPSLLLSSSLNGHLKATDAYLTTSFDGRTIRFSQLPLDVEFDSSVLIYAGSLGNGQE